MKTATITIGGKVYDAALLSVAETATVARALAEMEKATAAEDFQGVTESLETLTQVLFSALKNASSRITAEQLEAAAPNETMMAIGQLITASRQEYGTGDAVVG